jgi:hypothetical protein
LAAPPVAPAWQSLIGARPSRMIPPKRPCEESVTVPSRLARAVKMIGCVAVPLALSREPRLTTS